jgi:putative hemolysin
VRRGIELPDAVEETLSLSSTDRPRSLPSFSAGEWFDGPLTRALLAPIVDHLLALPTIERLYREMPSDARPFWDRALASLEIAYRVADAQLSNVPASGPLVVVANHPFGGADGLILGSVLSRVRPDVKVLGNSLLARLPELRRSLLPVDLYGGSASRLANGAALREALRWVAGGGALAVFPAGEVAHSSPGEAGGGDSTWSPMIARLAARAGASVLPVFFEGRNSRLFDLAGRIHPRLKTALLVRELLGKRSQTISVRVGTPIPSSRLKDFSDAEQMTAYIRLRTDALAPPSSGTAATDRTVGTCSQPIAGPEAADDVAREIDALPPQQVLARSGAFTVLVGSAAELPCTLREIGRLREIAFRAAGEGSGLARDIDRFDEHYLHLFVWQQDRREIVGAYRVGQTDVILPRLGVDGLYTSTLFRYDPRLLSELGSSLELGRAFVRPEYQRDYSPLLLLWKGVGAFVARNPRYRILFGTVSISNDYRSLSRQLLAMFLYASSYRADLARWVQPRNPPRFLSDGRRVAPVLGSVVRTIADVGALVAEIESDGKGVPVLLRQYLKLNARLLGFNIDPAFGGVLDGLMMVDLLDVEPELRVRYMGKSGAAAWSASQ